jgi:dihydroxyacetone kinase
MLTVVLRPQLAQRGLQAIAEQQEGIGPGAQAEAEMAGHVHHRKAPLAHVLVLLGGEGLGQVNLAGQGALSASLAGAVKTDSNAFDSLKALTAAFDVAIQTRQKCWGNRPPLVFYAL